MGKWLEQKATVNELIKARDQLRWEVEHNFYWSAYVKVKDVSRNTSLQGKSFDTMRRRFDQCERELALEFINYSGLLQKAFAGKEGEPLAGHASYVAKHFSDAYGTRWYMDEILAELAQLEIETRKLTEDIKRLEDWSRSQHNISWFNGVVHDGAMGLTRWVFRQPSIDALKKQLYEKNRQINRLRDRRDILLQYDNDQAIIAAYDKAITLGRKIKTDLQRLIDANGGYNPRTGEGAFNIPRDYGRERGISIAVRPGQIRYISQKPEKPEYDKTFWRDYDPREGCAVACVSMALSSLGIDLLPWQICENNLKGNPNGLPVYMIWANSGNCLPIEWGGGALASKLKLYQNDPSQYAPPIIGIGGHYMIVTGVNSDGSYQVVDPAGVYTRYSGTITQVIQYRK